MEGQKNKMTMLMAMRNQLNEENQRLNSNLKRMISKYNDLRKHIRFLEEERRGVDGSQVFNPDHGEKNQNKVPQYMGDPQVHSKKRKIENGFASSMDDSPCCDEKLLKKKHQALSKDSDEQTAAAPKRIISVQRTSEASVISDGCQWRKYGQKMTRNSTCPRSYYKCAMVPGCPVKKQVQRCAENPTIVITSYKGEHTHSLNPLAIAVIRASTNQPTAWSPFPTITLDLTNNRPNPAFHLQPVHLSNYSGQEMDNQNQLAESSIIDSVASIKTDPHFTAALAVAVAGFMLKSGAPIEGTPKDPSATRCADSSTK